MPEPNRIVIEKVEWKSVLPVLRLASAFKHALQPGKLVVALVALLALHFSGLTLDALLGINASSDGPTDPSAYEALVQLQAREIAGLMSSALALEHGVGPSSNGVVDALLAMFVGIPAYIFEAHPWFSLLFGIDLLFVLAMTSGILTRMSASQVCQNTLTPPGKALCHVCKRWPWYLLTPLMPAMLIVVVGAVLALVGLVLFNIPIADVLGSLGYGLLLLLGFVIAVVALLLLFALFLMAPALSVEGSDGFDAIARAFNYILYRPWQFAVYLLASLVYLAVVYVLVGAVASLTMEATAYCVEIGSFATVTEQHEERTPVVNDISEGVTRHEAILAGADDHGVSITTSGWIVARWLELVTAIVIAILFSTLCCLQTQVYVLLRRSADGTALDQYDSAEPGELWTDEQAEQPVPAGSAETEG